ncbi:MAG: NAD-dependent epimerase/dehydratase family protein [Rouxiella aceris]|uniref:NAD-dependent epimerase/dehydratase family protein n=1 Tax=Rouxiella aceris TaxID=2703884 RepID=UPI00284078B4|nr:NAD-dependent epimerase/dehydratase family protein [Rouxiella aceris]MDR3432624.1 NAD-dependent epimerase/dehydratase family protein [Rouxiella aceris]
MKTVLIVGGSGFIGSNLIQYFCARNYKVVNFSRSPCLINNSNLTNVYGDCTNIVILNEIFLNHKVDLVIHSLMSFSAYDKLDSCQVHTSTNLSAFIDLTNIMKNHCVNHLIYISSGGSIYGVSDRPIKETHEIAPVSFYGWMKEVSENYLQFFIRNNPDFKYIIFRPANVYGRFQKLDRLIGVALKSAYLSLPMKIFGDLNTQKDYIHINDLCEVIFKACNSTQWNDVYNIGSGIGTSTLKIIEYAQDITKNKIKLNLEKQKNGDVSFNILNVDKINRDFDKNTFISVKDGMNDMYEYVIETLDKEKY